MLSVIEYTSDLSLIQVDVMVQSLLEQLDMLGCADTLIGGGLIPGISGGNEVCWSCQTISFLRRGGMP